MRIPRYWARATHPTRNHEWVPEIMATGWSFTSSEEAREHAARRAADIAARLPSDGTPDSYDYAEAPLREEIIQEFPGDGEPCAMITRNRYGALVLNTASVCFVDIDAKVPDPAAGGGLGFFAMFSRKKREEAARRKAEALKAGFLAAMQTVKDWTARNPGRSFRVYRTTAGLRVLFTDGLYNPASDEVAQLFEQLDCDPLYRRLTRQQECFRARLTPKPWRCNLGRPPGVYPREDGTPAKQFEKWLKRYEPICSAHAACSLIETVGEGFANDEIQSVVGIHDQFACGSADRPLA